MRDEAAIKRHRKGPSACFKALKAESGEKMIIRKYQSADCKEIADLFYNTIHTVNAKDYTKAQLNAWTAGNEAPDKWNRLLQERHSIVAVDSGIIVGFGDIDTKGFIDHLFVHAAYQGKGVGKAICGQLEQAVQGKIVTHASVTAKPFFERRGYNAVKEQQVMRHGVFLTNFIMEKERHW